MAIATVSSKVHWNYFLALEHDLELASRYIEFCEANMSVFSIELAHLLLAAASEIDVVAKLLCSRLSPEEARGNIDQYRKILSQKIPDLIAMKVLIPRYGLILSPWENWAGNTNPLWWRSYNNVKHERDVYFQEATLKNALNSLAGLHCLVFHYYDLETKAINRRAGYKETTQALAPGSSLMRFEEGYYYSNIVV